MRKIGFVGLSGAGFLALGISLLTVGGCWGSIEYSDATLTGPWLLLPDSGFPIYVVFDGGGAIDEVGASDVADPPGTYSVQEDGSFTCSIELTAGTLVCVGQLTSETGGTFTGNPMPGPGTIVKVTDVSVFQGDWSGTLSRTTPFETKPVSFTVSSSGVVTSLTGLAGLVSGKIYAASNEFLGFWVTSEASPWDEVQLWGNVAEDGASGQISLNTGSDYLGTCLLTRTGGGP